jgi:hypothetical protein
MDNNWTCACCAIPYNENNLYGGRCTICDGIVCSDCTRTFNREHIFHKNAKIENYVVDALDPEYTTYLQTIKPHIIHGALISICIKCVTKTETEYLYTHPYEQLPLLINHTWYGTDTDRLYKDRLAGLIA